MRSQALQSVRMLAAVCLVSMAVAQDAAKVASPAVVPQLISYSGVLKDSSGKVLTAPSGVTFLIYKDQQGGAPLWLETQSVVPDRTGHFSAQLGMASAQGLPPSVFQSGEARWFAIQIGNEAEQPRVLLVAVPYAMKAADAQTLGGLPPSAFLLAPVPATQGPSTPSASTNSSATAVPPPNAAVTGFGVVNSIPLWDTTSDIINSAITQTGSGTTAKIGINMATPSTTLDVKGNATIRGAITLPATGMATVTTGKNSQPYKMTASTFDGGTSTAVNQNFQWQAEPAGNNTTTPSATLNLLFGQGTSTPAETGLKIGSDGQITFVRGQTFPGTGFGTITSVVPGTALTGGGSSGDVTLNVDTTQVVTAVSAGTDLVGGGTGGVQTLSLDTTKVPQLAAANNFIGNQTVSGNLSATGVVSSSGFQIGSGLIAFGNQLSDNAFLGFGGNLTTTGMYDTSVGSRALRGNTTGNFDTAIGASSLSTNLTGTANTAIGFSALLNNTAGSSNTATGSNALQLNTTGENNTGVGFEAGNPLDGTAMTASSNTFIGAVARPSTGTLTNASAIGANAEVESNAIVLGSINGVNSASANTRVGIGTTTPSTPLHVQGADATGTGVQSLTVNTSTSGNSFAIFTAKSGGTVTSLFAADGLGTGPMGTPAGYLGTFGNQPLGFVTNNVVRARILANGNVGIGTSAPDSLLSVNGTADKPGGGSWGTFSDRRLKDVDGSYTSGLSEIMKIHPVKYRYKDENGMGINDHEEHVGVVAQEVQQAIPEAVSENSKGYLLVNNDPVIWAMLNAIQEQQKEIAALRAQLKKRGVKESALESRVQQLEKEKRARIAKVREK